MLAGGGKVKNISGVYAKDEMWYNQLLDPNTADPLGTLCEKINYFFVGLTSLLSPLTSADVSRTSVDVIPDELFSPVQEVQGALYLFSFARFSGRDAATA